MRLCLAVAAGLILLCLPACGPEPHQQVHDGLTWNKDIKPLVEAHCGECHGQGKLALDLPNLPELASVMVSQVESGRMPPWIPGPESREMVGRREFPPSALATMKRWLLNPVVGEPSGSPAPPQPKVDFGRPPDAVLTLPGAGYASKTPAVDELRCFLLPSLPRGGWVRGYRWIVERQASAHHILVGVLGAADAAIAQALSPADSSLGWDCNRAALPFAGSLINTSVGPDGGFAYPAGYGVEIPEGGAIVLEVHALPLALKEPAQFGVELWLEPSAKPITAVAFNLPSEVPCALGVSTDPSNRCSREWAIARAVDSGARANNDRILADCGQTLAGYQQSQHYAAAGPVDHWLARSSCSRKMPGSCRIFSVHPHLHTRARQVHIEACPVSGPCQVLYATDAYRWVWESSYVYKVPLDVDPSWTLKFSATWDNGDLAQPSAATGEPGYDGPSAAPREPQSYHIADTARNAEMFSVTLECM